MVGRLGPDLGARGPTRGGTRPPVAAAAALSPRACPAAPRAPLLRAGELGIWGDQSRRGQHAERAAAPTPGALPPRNAVRAPGPVSAARARARAARRARASRGRRRRT